MVNRNELDTGEYDLSAFQRRLAADRAGGPASSEVPVSVTYGARSHPGAVRPNNEDHYLVGRLGRTGDVLTTNLPDGYVPQRVEQHAYAFAVADGMGGAAAGEVASALALSLGTSLTFDASRWDLRLDEEAAARLAEGVTELFRTIDEALTERARADPGLAGMGTTLTVAYTIDLDALVFHIGDSRAYLWRRGEFRQITRDETLAQAMVDAGQIAPEAVVTHPMRHVLTRAIGAGSGGADAVVSRVRLEPGDRLVLCTDGLTDMVRDDDIAAILARVQIPEEASQALVDAALARGGRDNVTVIVAQFGDA